MRRFFAGILLALFACPTFACDWSVGGGATLRYEEGRTGELVTIACAREKYDLRLHWFDEQSAYDGQLRVKAYPLLTGQRVFMANADGRVRPFVALGVAIKPAERCGDREHIDLRCNRLLPQPLAFALSAGVWLGPARIAVNHFSNGSTSSPNTGQDFIHAEWQFGRRHHESD